MAAAVAAVRTVPVVRYSDRMQHAYDIPQSRRAEYDALLSLLLSGADRDDAETGEMAAWIAASSLKDGHLWRGMGLENREELRAMMRENFSVLYEENAKDMRWKRFFYKRLCGWEGFDA